MTSVPGQSTRDAVLAMRKSKQSTNQSINNQSNNQVVDVFETNPETDAINQSNSQSTTAAYLSLATQQRVS